MYFHIHSNIIITKGKRRALISDLFNNQSFLIPNSLATFIKISEKKNKESFVKEYGFENAKIVNEYFDWLETKGFIEWFHDEETISFFPKLNNNWDIPFQLSNVIIDVSDSKHNWESIIMQINKLSIPVLQIRFFKAINKFDLENILLSTINSSLKGIELILPFDSDFNNELIEKILKVNIRIFKIVFLNSDKDFQDNILSDSICCNISYTKNDIKSSVNCGVINETYFVTDLDMYNEGLKYNTCLNRKISIDQNGEIKNCPSMAESFGNIKDTTLEEALNKEGFKKYWNITKGQINICKDCEFRNVCTDCRAYTQDPNDIYSKPLKCGYDPYTNIWEDWSTNPLSKIAIEHYGMQDLVKKQAI
jgi:SPASM domain peptide maturase of grasp-with-spasm system